MINNSWFLWAIFYCSFAVLLVNRLFKDNIWIYLLGLIITFFIPDSYNLSLYKFMYPFFLVGYFYHKASVTHTISSKHTNEWKIFTLLSIIYFAMLFFFHTDSYIYSSKYTLLGRALLPQLGIDVFRFSIGSVGSIWILLVLKKLYILLPNQILKYLCIIGRNSLGIYMSSGLIFNYILPRLTGFINSLNYLVVLGEAIIILLGTLLFTLLLKKWSVTNFLFLGGR